MIDLHVHSTFSDGSLTPEQLVQRARGVGLKAMALTDHDTTAGVAAFLSACADCGESGRDEDKLVGIPGVEISAEVERGTMHMLGYYVDHGDVELGKVLTRIRGGREVRNREILEKLNDLGLELAWEDVAAYAEEDVVGRPHFAQAMQARGFVSTKDEAFRKYLAKGAAAYVDRLRLSPEDSMAAIIKAGGIPVLSHPSTLELDSKALRRRVAELKEAGLQGIEVYYSEHSPSQQGEFLRFCRELDLLATGGSDFHGEINPGIELGRGFGSLRVPDEIADAMAARAGR